MTSQSSVRAWIVLALILALTVSIRVRRLDLPMERDEGEYAYAGQRLLAGDWPYVDFYHMKLPGIYAAYAGMLVLFGDSVAGIRCGHLLVHVLTVVALFLLVRRLAGETGALLSALTFTVASLDVTTQGLFANAEHFVALPAVAGLGWLQGACERGRPGSLLGSGLLLGLAFVVKQHGVFFIAAGLAYLVLAGRREGLSIRAAIFAAGAALPYGLTCGLYAVAGHFDAFRTWTITYPSSYVSAVSPARAGGVLAERLSAMARSAPGLWSIAFLALILVVADLRRRQCRSAHGLLLLWLVAAMAAVVPGFYFRPHYFLLTLPPVAALVGAGWRSAAGRPAMAPGPARRAALAVVVVILLSPVVAHRDYLFTMSPVEVSRATFPGSPFPEAVDVARLVRGLTSPDETVAVLGSEPQIYFYAGRRAATGFLYSYVVTEDHELALPMQRRMIREIEESRPAVLVLVDIPTSWIIKKGAPRELERWLRAYRRDFELVRWIGMRWTDRRNGFAVLRRRHAAEPGR